MEIDKFPTLFLCKTCQVYFYSYSKLECPTHVRCKLHNTRIADKFEVARIESLNRIIYPNKPKESKKCQI